MGKVRTGKEKEGATEIANKNPESILPGMEISMRRKGLI
jgi:hypothetical protein